MIIQKATIRNLILSSGIILATPALNCMEHYELQERTKTKKNVVITIPFDQPTIEKVLDTICEQNINGSTKLHGNIESEQNFNPRVTWNNLAIAKYIEFNWIVSFVGHIFDHSTSNVKTLLQATYLQDKEGKMPIAQITDFIFTLERCKKINNPYPFITKMCGCSKNAENVQAINSLLNVHIKHLKLTRQAKFEKQD